MPVKRQCIFTTDGPSGQAWLNPSSVLLINQALDCWANQAWKFWMHLLNVYTDYCRIATFSPAIRPFLWCGILLSASNFYYRYLAMVLDRHQLILDNQWFRSLVEFDLSQYYLVGMRLYCSSKIQVTISYYCIINYYPQTTQLSCLLWFNCFGMKHYGCK